MTRKVYIDTSVVGGYFDEEFELMKAVKKTKKFDAVKIMRDIRDKIDRDIEGMTFEQEKEYFKKGAEKYRRKVTSGS